ncbi:MAG: DUF2461 domain-containing protein [Oscillospiraceae bacterium]
MFTGFSDKTIDFMYGIRLNNEKAWFEAHKSEYLADFYDPMRDLADEVYSAIEAKYPHAGFIRKVSRIYRDARRLHGRGPYKENLWFSIQPPSEEWTSKPTFWFELLPDHWTCGLGYYSPKAMTMAKFRARIDANPKKVLALEKLLQGQSEFSLEGAFYARKKECAVPALAEWYNKKDFSFLHEEKNSKVLYSPDFSQRLIQSYEFLMPFYDYLITLDADPDPRI